MISANSSSGKTEIVQSPRLDWEGAPPPKLSQKAMIDMKRAWKANYPGEILDDFMLPGLRY